MLVIYNNSYNQNNKISLHETPMFLPDNHFYLNAESEMRAIIAPLKKYNINYFTYNKNYDDGSRVRLTTRADYLKEFYANNWHINGNIEAKNTLYMDQLVLTSALPNQKVVKRAYHEFGIAHGVYIIRSGPNYKEFFCFSTSPKQTNIINFYLNNIVFLQNFCDYFKFTAQDLLVKADQHTIQHGFHNISILQTQEADMLEFNRNLNYNPNSRIQLSDRQKQIAHELMLGSKPKQIADKLNLSTRTIEFYMQNLRTKLAVKNINQLLLKLQNFVK